MVAMAIAEFAGGSVAGAGMDLGKGAIIGALVVSGAYLAGHAVFRRGSAAIWALFMVLAAAALQLGWLGFFSGLSPRIGVLLQGVFGAAVIVFLSSVFRIVRTNALIGGLMLAAALSLVGIGLINLTGRAEVAGLMRLALVFVALLTVIFSVLQWNTDPAARLIAPGAAFAIAAPFSGNLVGFLGDGFALLPSTLFAIGIIAASIVALTQDGPPSLATELGLHVHGHEDMNISAPHPRECEADESEHHRLSETQLARVADYAGVAVWDWCPHGAHQTDSMPALMGADSRAPFTPDAIKAFIHKDDLLKLESKVLTPTLGDGSFDVALRLHNGRLVRFRGARAVDNAGTLERLVVFIESVSDATKLAKSILTGTAAAPGLSVQAPRAGAPLTHNTALASAIPDALTKGEITAAFQPIVSLDTGKVAGFETLARWPGRLGEADRATPEELVRAAQSAGKGGALARAILSEAAQHLSREMKSQNRRDMFVALNLSFAQMREPGFPGALKRAMSQYGLPPKSVVLELTESEAISDKGAADTFRALKDAGAALAFDDFGSGFSSLNNLRKYAFDYLKIDKSFVDGLVRGDESGKIAQAIAALGKDLGLVVIAEGVESKATADAARRIGCKLAQGYEFGAPERAAPEPVFAAETKDLKFVRRSGWRGGLR